MRIMKFIISIAFTFVVSQSYSQSRTVKNSIDSRLAYQQKFPLIDKYIDSTLKEWNVPGLALTVVYKDQILYTKGYGYRDLEKKLPVETNTLIPIASNTKLFTATLACILAEEGKLSLDKPVRNYLPSLVFSTDELNAKVTLRDMLSHRTGLPRYDGIWVNSPLTRKELLEKVTYMKPALGFREGYLYNNMMFLSAGAAMETITGKSWEDLIREKIFGPLKMNCSFFTLAEYQNYSNHSLSYFEPDSTKKLLAKQYTAIADALGPAGTIKSTAEDMGNWMIAQLNNGLFKGQQVIPAKAIAETLIPNNISDKAGRYDELSNGIYCLGRTIQMYKGHKIASHGGAIDGYYSFVMLFPKDSIGIFVVVNADHGRPLSNFVPLDVFDRMLGLPTTPWSQRYMKEYLAAKKQGKIDEDSLKASQVKETKPSHGLQAYTGTYQNATYGDIKVELNNDQLVFYFRSQKSNLHHFHYDQFVTKEEGNDNPDFRLSFLTNNKGDIDKIKSDIFGDNGVEFVKK
jgi:CubicO group peptidase (beta-lactamase class C family)